VAGTQKDAQGAAHFLSEQCCEAKRHSQHSAAPQMHLGVYRLAYQHHSTRTDQTCPMGNPHA
jgi:hypothetical protein